MTVKKSVKNSPTTATPDPQQKLTKESTALVTQAKAMVIKTADDCTRADEIRKQIKGVRARVKEFLGPIVEAAHKAHKLAKERFNQLDEPLVEVDRILGDRIGSWVREQRRIEEEARIKAQLEAQKAAIEAAQELRVEQANNLAAAGEVEEAAELIEAPIEVAPVKVVVESAVPKIDGRTIRDKYRAEVYDLKKLVDAVAAGVVPLPAVMGSEKFLNAQAKLFKNTEAMGYPGVRVVLE